MDLGGKKIPAFKPVLVFKERCFRNTHKKSASFLLTLEILCPICSSEKFNIGFSFHEFSMKQLNFSVAFTA